MCDFLSILSSGDVLASEGLSSTLLYVFFKFLSYVTF
jgi:hypothetical protein